MNLRLALLLVLVARLAIVGCATPLTVAEPRDSGAPVPTSPGEFGETGPLDSGFTGEENFLADPPDS